MATPSVKKAPAKKAAKKVAPAPGVQGSTKVPYATVIEMKHRILPFIWHTHHLVSVLQIEKKQADMLREGATEAVNLASRLMGVKVRVVCVEPVREGGAGIDIEAIRKAAHS